jgi:hypothetical protein
MKTAKTKTTTFELLRSAAGRAARLFRAAAVLAAIFALAGLVFAERAYGQVGEAALSVGRQLSGFEDLTGKSYRVLLNGQPVFVASTLTELSVADVLDRFQKHCEQGNALGEELSSMAAALEKREGSGEAQALRRATDRDGLVACLTRPSDRGSLTARLQRFSQTLNLSDVGHLRYAYAKATKSGKTHVIVAWTADDFDVSALTAGADRDAPGRDIDGAARPLGSVRLLAAGVEGAPYGAWVYDTAEPRARVLEQMDRDMQARGWQPIAGVAEEVEHGRAFTRNGRDVVVFAHAAESSTVVSMIESRAAR